MIESVSAQNISDNEKKDGLDHIVNDHAMNGTFLNGKKLEDGVPAPLSKNDDIRLGNTKLIYMI